MIIRSIRLRNYGVYAGEHFVEPALSESDSPSITLVGGLNGEGKTSLLDALLLALYGSRSPSFTQSGLTYTAYLRDVTNRFAGADDPAWVEVDLLVDDRANGQSIRIRRSWRFGAHRAVEKLDAWQNGKPDGFLARAWDTYVEGLIPVGLASLFFFDGEKIAQLADAEETPLGVQEAIKSLLGVDMLDRLVDDLSQVVRRAEGRLRQGTAQGSLSEAQAILDALEKKREVAAQDMAHLHALIDRADALAQDARDQYLRHGGAVIEQLDHLHEMETSLRERLSTARGTMLALSAGALPLFAVRNLLSQVAAGSAQEQERDRARMALPVVRTINESLIRWLDEQPGEGEFKDNLSNYLASQYEQLSVVAGGGNLLGLSSFGAEQIARLLEEAEESVVRPAREALAIDDGIRQDLGQVQSHLAINANTNKADELFERIAQLNAQQVDLQAKKMLAEQKVQSIDKELTVARSALRRTVEGLVGLEEDERVIKYAQKSQATLGEFRSMVAKAKIDALSTCVEDSFRRLTRKASLVSRIDIDPEDLSIRLFDRDSCPFPKSRLSSGEKQMLAVALLWGLARASGRTLPVMIDTPMGRLDSSHRMNFVTEYLPNAGGQVIVLSTDTEIVGPYLEALSKHVGRSYRLVYSDETRATAIHEGYFEGGEQHVG